MKKIILLSLVLGLGGCAATTDMMNNQYMSVKPTSTDLYGFWSGNNGPYAVTYSFNKDGTGLMCSSWNGKDFIEKLKVNGNEIIVQSGLKQTIKSKTDSNLELKINYYAGGSYQYSPDPKLINASPYCEKVLKN
ncbi:J517_1871 family lipoprotein [Acinetobacter seifertii]|uniref:J517_1871 family lipoprotein n=1 Tax=Acinetobacter seifertii TaxID=1530123 RepID=UPI000C22B844|nr:J517_1871 family lipoprotein [Acinetobacter seifertii]PJG67839.1 hypothetical protein CVD09_03820 [Acinetobacter seifertii]